MVSKSWLLWRWVFWPSMYIQAAPPYLPPICFIPLQPGASSVLPAASVCIFSLKKKKKDRYQEKQEESCPCPVSGASSLSFLAIPPSRCHSCPHASMVSVCLQQKTKHLTLPSCKCHHELHTALQPSVMLSCASPLYLNLWSLLCFFIICYRNTYHSLFLRMIFWFNVHWIFIWRISHFSAIRTMFFCVSFPTDKSRT